jgi:hypothetical protein
VGGKKQALLESSEFIQALLSARRRSPLETDVTVLVVLDASDTPVAFGTPCSWREGIAEKVLAGELKTDSVLFSCETSVIPAPSSSSKSSSRDEKLVSDSYDFFRISTHFYPDLESSI